MGFSFKQLLGGPSNDARQIFGDRGFANLDPLSNSLFPADKSILNAGPKPPAEQTLAPGPTPDPLQTLITPTEMPSITSNQSRTAKRRSYAQQLARMGRMSTILSQSDDTLG